MSLRKSERAPLLTIGIVLALLVLLVNAVVSYGAIRQLVYNNGMVAHTLRVISELQTTLSLLKDAEMGQRSYLFTRDTSYLEPYNRAVQEIPGHLDKLATLTKDEENLKHRIPELQRLTLQRLDLAIRTVEMEKSGKHTQAAQSLADSVGKQQMDQLRSLIDTMLEEEQTLLLERTDESKDSLRRTIFTFSVASFMAVLFTVLLYFMGRYEVRKLSEAARVIQERESWLDTTLRSIGDAVIVTDKAGSVMFLNGVAEQLTGYNRGEAEGKRITEVFPIFNETDMSPAADPVARVIASGGAGQASQALMRDRKGREFPIEDSAAPIYDRQRRVAGVVLVFRDVSRQRQAEESARKSEKLAAAGRLAATIAHEINNPLEAITNLLYLAKTCESLDLARQYLHSADHELSRVAHITRQTLGFYRASSVPVVTKVSTLLDEVLSVYSGRIRSKQVLVEKNFDEDKAIAAIRGNLVQIFSNLISNALDALSPGGTLHLRATAVDGGTEVEISDNGTGIPAEHREKVFEAFFTTKSDVGTGLGLWVVKDLLEKQGGSISVESSTEPPNQGTRFVLHIPSIQVAAPVESQTAAS